MINYTLIFLTLSLFSGKLLSLNADDMKGMFSVRGIGDNGSVIEITLTNTSNYGFRLKYDTLNQAERLYSMGASAFVQKFLPLAMASITLSHGQSTTTQMSGTNVADFKRFYINVYQPHQPIIDKIKSYKCDVWLSKKRRAFGYVAPKTECTDYEEPWLIN